MVRSIMASESVPLSLSDLCGRREPLGGGKPIARHTPGQREEVNTPVATLNNTCNRVGVIPDYQWMAQKDGSFMCTVAVTANNGETFKGVGWGGSKQAAKQDAAKNVLEKIENDWPYAPYEIPVDVESPPETPTRGGGIQNLDNLEVDVNELGERYQQMAVASLPPSPQEEKDAPITVEQGSDRVVITVKLNQAQPQQPQPKIHPGRNLAWPETSEIVRGWSGPLMEKFKGLSREKMLGLRNPVKIVEDISEEQNFSMHYTETSEPKEEGKTDMYYCVLEVYQNRRSIDEEEPQNCPTALFTQIGYADNAEDAKKAACKDFLHMLRMLILL